MKVIVLSLFIICAIGCTALIISQKITRLLFLHPEPSPKHTALAEEKKTDALFYPARIPLNKTTVLRMAVYYVSAVSPPRETESPRQPPPEYIIPGLSHCYQTWNNCGPASLSMLLSAFDIKASQEEIREQLRPHNEDKHTSLTELKQYAEQSGLFTLLGSGGSTTLIKELITEGIPVMLKVGLDPPDDDWMCHYIVVAGFSDDTSEFILMDSLYGPYVPYSYKKADEFWSHFMWTYLVVAPEEKQKPVLHIVNAHTNTADARARLEQRVLESVTENSESAFDWYNLGKLFLLKGQHAAALVALETAYDCGLPWRLPWYDVAMYEIYLRNTRYDDILRLSGRVLSRNPYSEEARYYRACSFLHLGKNQAALTELTKALAVNPVYEPARALLDTLKEAE